MICEIDQDGNGEISFNEFVWLMTRLDYKNEEYPQLDSIKTSKNMK